MRLTSTLGLAIAAVLAGASGVQAQGKERPFAPGFDGWTFTVAQEQPRIANCRAVRKNGNNMVIMALRSNWQGYFSVNADGRKGKWPGTIVNIPGKPPGVMEWRTTGEANGARMWFAVEKGALDEMANAGAFEWSLPDSEDHATVRLGRRSADAWGVVNKCVLANGG